MKKHKYLLPAAILTVLMLAAFWAGNVSAATGCFSDTNGLPAEQAICWMKENGLALGTLFKPNNATTRAQAAVWLQRSSQIPPTTGLILVSEGFGNWLPFNSTDNLSYTYFSSATYVQKATAGSSFLSLQPSVPVVLYGRSLQFLGVEFCYDATAGAALSYVEINTYTHSSGSGSRNMRFSDSTSRTDTACNYYVLSTPYTLTSEDGVNFFIQANWAAANNTFRIGRTTFVFQATGSKAIAPADINKNVITLQEADQGSGPSTEPTP